MLSPGRQAEISEVIAVLEKFRPTKIAVEAGFNNDRVLVIYGAGHLGWLQYAFDSNPDLHLRELAEFAG